MIYLIVLYNNKENYRNETIAWTNPNPTNLNYILNPDLNISVHITNSLPAINKNFLL